MASDRAWRHTTVSAPPMTVSWRKRRGSTLTRAAALVYRFCLRNVWFASGVQVHVILWSGLVVASPSKWNNDKNCDKTLKLIDTIRSIDYYWGLFDSTTRVEHYFDINTRNGLIDKKNIYQWFQYDIPNDICIWYVNSMFLFFVALRTKQ